MELTPYPAYKPSGVDWIGDIPHHWEVIKLKYLIKNLESGVSVNSFDESVSQEEIGILKTSCVYDYSFRATENKKVVADEVSKVACSVKANSLIISRMNTPDLVGASGFVNQDHPNLFLPDRLWQTVFYDEKPVNAKWLGCIMKSKAFRGVLSFTATGTSSSMKNLSKDDLLNIIVPAISVTEQTAIANFLDSQTNQLDQLIARKRRLIELLRDERAGLINDAVTKGLNPNAPRCDSGLPWLGDIPRHWQVKKLKYLTKIISKGTTPSTVGAGVMEEGPIRFLKAENILASSVVSEYPQFFIDENTNALLSRSELEANDVLIVIAGATIGKVAVLGKHLLPANTNQAVCFIRLTNRSLVKWIGLLLQSTYIKQTIDRYSVQAAQPNLSMENIGNFVVLVPTPIEQAEIIEHIEAETAQIDRTVGKIEQEIGLLNEYRSVLISEAVTGKIKVS